MSRRPWHRRYHSDALSGYLPLSLEERGAYTTILDMLYDRGEPLAYNERLIAGYMGVSIRKARAVIDSLVEKGKLIIKPDGRISNRRFEKERENELETARKHAENGAKSARKRAENELKTICNLAENEKNLNEINDSEAARLQPIPYPYPDSIKEREANASPKKSRGSRLDCDMLLPLEWRTFAETEGHPDPQREWQKFTDYWRAKPGAAGVKLDWMATWRNWIRKEVEHGKSRRKPADDDDHRRRAGLAAAMAGRLEFGNPGAG